MSLVNYLGTYETLDQVWEAYPEGGKEGDYLYIASVLKKWNKYTSAWADPTEEDVEGSTIVSLEEDVVVGSSILINYLGRFETLEDALNAYPEGGNEGDYIYVGDDIYAWDKYANEWVVSLDAPLEVAISEEDIIPNSNTFINYLGGFVDRDAVWQKYPEGGKVGDYLYIASDLHIWDKYICNWVAATPPDESSQIRPIEVLTQEGVVEYSENYINYLGVFESIEQAWEAYPEGGKEGDYIIVGGEQLRWNKYTSNWGEYDPDASTPARPVATIYGDLHVHNDVIIGEDLYARILETFTTKKWVLEQGYISMDDVTSELVMSKIVPDNTTIEVRDGKLVVIGGGGGGTADSVEWDNITGKPDWIGDTKPTYTLDEIAGSNGDGFVTLKNYQIIEGVKNFANGAKFNGALLSYDEEKKAWVFPGNIIASGGITAFGSLSTPVASLFEALPIDGSTIKRDPATNELYVDTNVVGGSGGGSLDEEQLEEYLRPYATIEYVSNNYATKSSVNAISTQLNNFLSGSDTDTIINKWSELETFLAGLTETDNLATILSGKANKATTLAGYGITDAYTKSHIDSNFVTIGTKQEITGEKDFVGGFKVNGGLVEYNATLKTWVFNGDLLVTGGMAAFSNISGFKPSTITDAVLIDDRTIKRNADGLLYAVAQETDGINEEQLADYLTTNSYATQSWVTGRGYITGITSSMVTNALGYTPYNSSNPSGYITSSDSITGNAATSHRLIEEVVTDLNNATAGRIFTMTSGYGSTGGNKPDEGWVTGLTLQYALNGRYRRQLAFCGSLYFRTEENANWGAWRKILDSYNYSDYALPITGGTVNGNVRINKFLAVGAASSSTNIARAQIHLVSSGANPCDLYLGADDTLYWSVTARNAADAGGFNKAFALYDVTNSAYRLIVLPNGNIGIGTTSPETRLHVSGYAKITNDLYLGGVMRNANATWLLGEETSNGALAIGSATFAQDRYLNNLNGKLRLTAEGGVEAQLTYLDSNPTLGSLDAKGVLRLTPTNGFGLYSWVRNTGDGYIQVGSDSRYATPKSFNLVMQALGGNVGIGTTSPTSKLHTVSSSGWGVTFDGGSKSKIVGAHADGFGMLVMSTTPTTSDSYLFRVWQGSLTGASGSGTAVLDVRSNGVVNIGGNLLASGGVTAQNSSDKRLKKNLRKFNASKTLMSLGAVWEYEYIDSEVAKNHIYEGTHYGLIYQHVKGTKLDVMCHKREDGMGALNYLHPKFISLIAGATMENISEVKKLKRKIRHLENKVKQLENRA